MTDAWKILLVEDSEDDYVLTRSMLDDVKKGQYELVWAATLQSGLDCLHEFQPDVFLVDYRLGPDNGVAFIRAARAAGARAPAILLTGYAGEQIETEALQAGVTDFVEKIQASGPLLERTIRFALERQQIQARLERLNAELENRVAARTRDLEAASAREKSERALLRQILDILPVGVWLVDQNRDILQGNPAGQAIWAGSREASRETNLEDFARYRGWWVDSGREIQSDEWADARAIASGEVSINEEIEIECLDGSRKYILNSAIPLRAEDGSVQGAIIVNNDITRRKQSELDLREKNQLLEKMFSSIYLHIAYLDRDFNFIRVNRRYAEADGRPEDFFPGKNHFELYPSPENEAIFRQVIETGRSYIAAARPFQYPEQPERGVTYWDWQLIPVQEPDGRVSGLVLSLLDVTAQQRDRQAMAYQAYLLENVSDAIVAADTQGQITAWNRAAEQTFGWQRAEVLGVFADFLLHTEYSGLPAGEVLRMVNEDGLYEGEAVQTCRDGRKIPVSIRVTGLRDDAGVPSGYLSIQRDITRQREGAEKERRSQEMLEAQAELSRLMADTNLDYHRMLEILARMAAALIGDACVVTQISVDRKKLSTVAFSHRDPEALRALGEVLGTGSYNVGEGFVGNVATSGAPLLIAEVPQQNVRARVSGQAWPYLERFGVHSVLIVPIKIGERLFGTLGLTRDQPGKPFTAEDQVFLEGLAGRAALWIANAELYDAVQRELAERRRVEAELSEIQRRLLDGAEQERMKLARELHDGPMQDLYGLEFQLHVLFEQLPGGVEGEFAKEIRASLETVIGSLRSMSVELRPPSLSRLGLGPAIISYCEQLRRSQAGLTFHLDLFQESQPAISERVRVALFRIFQIAVINILRHAQAHNATVRLHQVDDSVVMDIQDDGVGFEVPERWVELARRGHLGLVGARERVEALGGKIEVFSRPGEGATIRVTVPKEG